MRQIFRVFLSDLKRLSTNVVALVIIMGLSIIPALYAWFNILSNWDPYGESATSQMKIAVYSEDQGVSVGSVQVNIGDSVIGGLEANSTIGWVFAESRDETLAGVYSGEYYAALIIPEDFTVDMISFLSGDPENPKILYYENSKKNAIATKITSKVKNTVQQQVNTSFISTLAEVLSKTGNAFSGTSEGEETDMVSALLAGMEEVDRDLTTYVSILDGFVLITESTGELVDSSQSLIPNLETVIDSGSVALSGMQGTVLAGAQTVDTVTVMTDIALDSARDSLNNLQQKVKTLNTLASLEGGRVEDVSSAADALLSYVDMINSLVPTPGDTIDTSDLERDVEQLKTDTNLTQEKLNRLTTSIDNELTAIGNELTTIQENFHSQAAPTLDSSVYEVEKALIQAQILLGSMDDQFFNVALALQSYEDTLEGATSAVTETRDYVASLQTGLRQVMDGLQTLVDDPDYQEIASILQADPAAVAEFAASPVVMETVTMYEISNYGSAMAPFYTVLALWVGALILVALIHVKVIREPGLEQVKPWHEFFGRYLTFYLVGQAQALIAVLGNLFFVQIQCVHPFLFWLAASFISFVFTMILYALTYAFGNVGEAIAVIIMVIQVAGAGCTFPIEVLPAVYQAIYKFLPFVYSMDALKACVGGMYGAEYWVDMGILAIYGIVFILIGIFLRKPFAKLNEMIEHSKEKSGVMI